MYKKVLILSAALCATSLLKAQEADTLIKNDDSNPSLDESSFTFTESQLGEDDNDGKTSTVLSSASNVFTANVSMKLGASGYRFRAYDNKYNEVFINGVLVNDPERGYFRFSQIGGLNNISRNSDNALPFEENVYCMPGIAGSVNYDFRASQVPQGNKLTLSLANRTYTGRLMYSYGSGVNPSGWSFAGNITARYASISGFKNVEGAFYNSLSYYFGAEKIINSSHTLSLSTFANPTMRGSRGASTDEAYFLAGSNSYNPYLGYYNGEVRNSRVVRDFAPTTVLTWDFAANDNLKITTSAILVYSMYSNTKLAYNNSTNPAPDYYKNLPSSFYDVYDANNTDNRRDVDLQNWNYVYDYWTSSVNSRYINFDKLYFANVSASKNGGEALYYMPQIHTDRISAGLSSALRYNLGANSRLNLGISASRNKVNHYQTVYDMLGAKYLHNTNSYAVGSYDSGDYRVQYDMLHPDKLLQEGDVFGYDYNIFVDNADLWSSYSLDAGGLHAYVSGKIGYTDMFREGKMQNGFAPNNSYGPSKKAYFLDGGGKIGSTLNLGKGHVIDLGFGYQADAPNAGSAFSAPEINNNFVVGLDCEKILSGQLSYAYSGSMVKATLTGYYNKITDATKWSCFYSDDEHSFTYVSMTGIEKEYYGVELGVSVKLTSKLELLALGAVSEAKYTSDCNASYMLSNSASYKNDVVLSKGMREDGTPLTLASLGFTYNLKGWYLELTGNYFDRIYLSFSPVSRYAATLKRQELTEAPAQTEGKGGFMLDGSIGKNFRLKKGSLYAGLMLTNILNNCNICTGGYEQSRTDYSYNTSNDAVTDKVYKFSANPKKYYAWGINGMFNIVYRF